jgi:hypothetical protein
MGAASENVTTARSLDADTVSQTAAPACDIALMPRDEWARYMDASCGYLAGIDRGRQLADDEAAALHHQAVRVVHAMAKLDPHADRERRRRQRERDTANRHQPVPWAEETAPIMRATRDGCGCAGERCNHPGCRNLGSGWPLVVVLTPAEAAEHARMKGAVR